MILHWLQLELFFGNQISQYAARFQTAGQTTYGLLLCRSAMQGARLDYSSGEHAEARLLQSSMWREEIPAALEAWTQLDDRIVVAIVINRSPCGSCTQQLCGALGELGRQFPLRAHSNRFLLASRGAYEDKAMVARTTQNDLHRLNDSGWELAVLQTGDALSRSGEWLREGVERVCGRGVVRLS